MSIDNPLLFNGAPPIRAKVLERYEDRRARLHDYIRTRLDRRDYRGVAAAATDLCELAAEIRLIEEAL